MKLTVNNTWEYLTYFLGDIPIPEKTGGTAKIAFPDGTVHDIKYSSVIKPAYYSDMGRPYTTGQYLLLAHIKLYGQMIYYPLQNFEIVSITPKQ